MKSERSREEYCSVAVSVPVVSDVEPSFLIDSQWSGSRATVGRINYLMKKNWLRASDAQKKKIRFSLQIRTLYGLKDKRFTSHREIFYFGELNNLRLLITMTILVNVHCARGLINPARAVLSCQGGEISASSQELPSCFLPTRCPAKASQLHSIAV